MSSWKNIGPSRAHQERAQPRERAKYGLLEKHKDYVKRARAFHKKEKRLLAMKRRAALRNPDEFYFGMNSTKLKGGVHSIANSGPKLTSEEVLLLKSQDAGYIQAKRVSEQHKLEKGKSSLHRLGEKPANSHLVFVDEEDARDFDVVEHFGTVPDAPAYNRVRRAGEKRPREEIVSREVEKEKEYFEGEEGKKKKGEYFEGEEEKKKDGEYFEGEEEKKKDGEYFEGEEAWNIGARGEEGEIEDMEEVSRAKLNAYRPKRRDQVISLVDHRSKTRGAEAGYRAEDVLDKKTIARVEKARKKAYDELKDRSKRIKSLSNAQAQLEFERMMQAKGRKQIIQQPDDPSSRPIVRFKRQRRK